MDLSNSSKNMSKKHSVVSLFSGAGGMDLGFKTGGNFDTILANDILLPPALTYSYNFGHHIVNVEDFNNNGNYKGNSFPLYILGDIARVDFSSFNANVDMIIGGPPCQDFSIVRGTDKERQGIKVERGRLYAHFIRALHHIQPKAFVFENVPGLKTANKSMAYQTILKDFSELHLRWDEIKEIAGNNGRNKVNDYFILFSGVVDSANFGVPQRRKRLIIIGIRKDLIDNRGSQYHALKDKISSELNGDNSIFKKYPLTPLEVFEGKTLPELQNVYVDIMKSYKDVSDSIKSKRAQKWKEEIWDCMTFDIIKDYLVANYIKDPIDCKQLDAVFEEHFRLLQELGYFGVKVQQQKFADKSNIIPKEAGTVIERLAVIPPDENHEFVRGTKWEVEGRGMSLVYRRIHPLKPSYTIVAYGGGGTWGYHYQRDRGKLTNRERARLQTFPDSFLFKGTSSQVRAQIGEAVPPVLSKKIAQVVDMVLREVV